MFGNTQKSTVFTKPLGDGKDWEIQLPNEFHQTLLVLDKEMEEDPIPPYVNLIKIPSWSALLGLHFYFEDESQHLGSIYKQTSGFITATCLYTPKPYYIP